MRDNWGTPVRHLFEKKGVVDARFSQILEQSSKDYDFLLRMRFDDLSNQTELERVLSQALNWYREAEFLLRSRYQSRLAYLLMWIALEHLVLADVPLYEIDPRTGSVILNKQGKPRRNIFSKIKKIKERVGKIVPARTGPSFRDNPRNWVPSFDPKSTLDELYDVRNEIAHQATFLWDWEDTELGRNLKNWSDVVEKTGTLKYILRMVIEFVASKHLKCLTIEDLWFGI